MSLLVTNSDSSDDNSNDSNNSNDEYTYSDEEYQYEYGSDDDSDYDGYAPSALKRLKSNDDDFNHNNSNNNNYNNNNNNNNNNNKIGSNNKKTSSSIKMFADKTKGISIKPTIGRQVSYETYDEEEMKAILKLMTKMAIDQTGLLQSDAELLLQTCQYNVTSLLKEFSHYTDKLCKKAGVLLDKVGVNTDKKLDLCTICYCDNIPGDETVTLGCKHWFCIDCFKAQ